MAGLPKKLYYVLIKPGGTPLKYGQKGGGKYTDGKYAKSHAKSLQEQGVHVKLYESEMNWTEVPLEKKNPMEGMPGLW